MYALEGSCLAETLKEMHFALPQPYSRKPTFFTVTFLSTFRVKYINIFHFSNDNIWNKAKIGGNLEAIKVRSDSN